MHPILTHGPFAPQLRAIDQEMGLAGEHDIPELFAAIPLDVFAILTCSGPTDYPNIENYFPRMPSDEMQAEWLGSCGQELLRQSVTFLKTCITQYEIVAGRGISHANILDYGVGWGRIIRLFNRYVPEAQLFGVDAWSSILDVARDLGVRAELRPIPSYPAEGLPFDNTFDLIFAFSIFTHLSEKSAALASKACADRLSGRGIFIFTIRPIDFFGDAAHEPIRQSYTRRGYGFLPNPHIEPVDGDISYGDTVFAVEYIQRHWTWLKIIGFEYNFADPYQLILVTMRL
jgi:hypothetical protein